MEVKDLMIGDFIIHGFKQIGKVTELSNGIVTVYDKGLDDGEGHCEVTFAENEIQPIPLTPEILEKNGFVNLQHSNCYHIYDNLYFSFELNELYVNEGYENSKVCNIHYVHELQHALRLCGIDKEIIL